jgi:GWxTD domain-containing protein
MRKAGRVLVVLGVLLVTACASHRAIKSLDSESQEFLSKARYLISKDERRALLALPGLDERKAWIANFWEKRDADPSTPVNEFKEEYFRRIDEANRLFKEGTTPGWLGDRGHLYITLGPPDNRETYPRGVTFYGLPTEIWYYNFFPVVFIDDNWSGYYRLAPESVAQVSELNKTQVMLHPNPQTSDILAASLNLEIVMVRDGEAVIRLKLPYKDIWFKAEGDSFQTTLDIEAEAADSSGKTVWQDKKSYPISFGRSEYLKTIRQEFQAEFPVALSPGEYDLKVSFKNAAGGGDPAVKKTKLTL